MEEQLHGLDEGLEAFKEALRAEYRERIEELRAQYEEELSEVASRKRQEVELQVARVRDDQEKRYRKALKEAQESILTDMRHQASAFVSESVRMALVKMEEELSGIRGDAEAYGPLLNDLATEAVEILGEPAVVIVAPEEGRIPLRHPLIEKVREEPLNSWGGCVVTDAATETRLVDNTLRTRWGRVEKQLRFLLSESFDDVFAILERTAQQLRLS